MSQAFDIIGASGGIGDMAKSGFFLQNKLGISCHSARKRIGRSITAVKRQEHNRIRAASARRQSRRCRPQHIDVRIALRRHPVGHFADNARLLRLQLCRFSNTRP